MSNEKIRIRIRKGGTSDSLSPILRQNLIHVVNKREY